MWYSRFFLIPLELGTPPFTTIGKTRVLDNSAIISQNVLYGVKNCKNKASCDRLYIMERDDRQEITPKEIKEIRQSLGLSQAEAGRLLGGGPRAFAKYESGSVRPSVPMVKILKLLQIRPEELRTISGEKRIETSIRSGPFEVESGHISELEPSMLGDLLRKLLSAEAQENGLPISCRISVPSSLDSPDGGEDARIEWEEGPPRTKFLPNRLCMFQMKTGQVYPSRTKKEILSKGKVKPRIREVLEQGGLYVMLCSHPYANQAIEKRERSIRETLKKSGLETEKNQILFHDSDWIADWVNSRQSVASWLLRKRRPGLVSSFFGSHEHWSGRAEHYNSTWVEDPRLPDFEKKLRIIVKNPKGVARVVGPPCVGKSRLALEALGPTQEEEDSGVRLSDLVLYAVEPEAGSQAVKEYALELVNSKKRAVLVVDRCDGKTRLELENIVSHKDSQLSLVTICDRVSIYDENDENSENTLSVGPADNGLVDKIVQFIDSSISLQDRLRIVGFSGGAILCAQLVSRSWRENGMTSSASDEAVIERFVGPDDMKTARIISAFGGIPMFPDISDELKQMSKFEENLSPEKLRASIERLKERGVVQKRGYSLTLQPEHVAIVLAEEQWKRWEEKLSEMSSEELEEFARRTAPRLAMLNTKRVATRVARKFSRFGGTWFLPEKLADNSQILSSLAQIDPRAAVDLLNDIFDPMPTKLESDAGDSLFMVLEKIAFIDDTFEDAAKLVFELACNENAAVADKAATRFKSFFPSLLPECASGFEKRLKVIDEIMKCSDDCGGARMSIVVDSLLEGTHTRSPGRIVGESEIHGSRPAIEPWLPNTYQECRDYAKECAYRLVIKPAKRDDDAGEVARTGLGVRLREFVLLGWASDVEGWVHEVLKTHPYWPEALNSLNELLEYDSEELESSVREKVNALIGALTPKSLDHRVRFLVTEMPSDYLGAKEDDIEKRDKLQAEEVRQLAKEALESETELEKFIPRLSKGKQRMAWFFGGSLAEEAREPLRWKKLVMNAFEKTPENERNHDLLVGYMRGFKRQNPEEFEEFKREAARSSVFARVLPALTLFTGVGAEDVLLVVDALKNDLVPPGMMNFWGRGRALDRLKPEEVCPLFDFMLGKRERPYFETAIRLIRMYAYKEKERLDRLHSQLLLAAEYPSIVGDTKSESRHHYEALMKWILLKGSEDSDAVAVAVVIVKQLVSEDISYEGELMIGRVLGDLLANLGEVVWPLMGHRIAESRSNKWRLSGILRRDASYRDCPPPILSLSENVLFGWCYANPEVGPEFVAATVPMFNERGEEVEFNPVIMRLLDEFGDRKDVLQRLEFRVPARWAVSPDSCYAPRIQLLTDIENHHEKPEVQRWARKMLDNIRRQGR